MKAIKALSIMFLAIFVLSACSMKDTKDHLSFYNGQQTIRYGMDKDSLLNILGALDENRKFQKTKTLSCEFVKNNAAIITLSDKFHDDEGWRTSKGIRLGSTEVELQKAYDLSDQFKDKLMNCYSIRFSIVDNEIVKSYTEDYKYIFSFVLNENNKVKTIILGDKEVMNNPQMVLTITLQNK